MFSNTKVLILIALMIVDISCAPRIKFTHIRAWEHGHFKIIAFKAHTFITALDIDDEKKSCLYNPDLYKEVLNNGNCRYGQYKRMGLLIGARFGGPCNIYNTFPQNVSQVNRYYYEFERIVRDYLLEDENKNGVQISVNLRYDIVDGFLQSKRPRSVETIARFHKKENGYKLIAG